MNGGTSTGRGGGRRSWPDAEAVATSNPAASTTVAIPVRMIVPLVAGFGASAFSVAEGGREGEPIRQARRRGEAARAAQSVRAAGPDHRGAARAPKSAFPLGVAEV